MELQLGTVKPAKWRRGVVPGLAVRWQVAWQAIHEGTPEGNPLLGILEQFVYISVTGTFSRLNIWLVLNFKLVIFNFIFFSNLHFQI